jgi:hypothetical protein
LSHINQNPFADSAGVPWQGRQFSANSWADDDGSTPAAIAQALAVVPEARLSALVEALRESRLLIPLIAELNEAEDGPHGLKVDKSADLAIVAVSTPDGKTAIPAFSSVAELANWRADARPVPVQAAQVMVAAASEGHERVVIDPAGAAIGLRRPALAAIAQGLPWLPAHANPEVLRLVERAAAASGQIDAVRLLAGDPLAKLTGPELVVELSIAPGLGRAELDAVLEVFAADLATEQFRNLVDSVAVRVVASSPGR